MVPTLTYEASEKYRHKFADEHSAILWCPLHNSIISCKWWLAFGCLLFKSYVMFSRRYMWAFSADPFHCMSSNCLSLYKNRYMYWFETSEGLFLITILSILCNSFALLADRQHVGILQHQIEPLADKKVFHWTGYYQIHQDRERQTDRQIFSCKLIVN